MEYGPYEQIHVEVSESILTLALHRPEKLNAFTGRMMHEMMDVFTKVNADDDARDHRHWSWPCVLCRRGYFLGRRRV